MIPVLILKAIQKESVGGHRLHNNDFFFKREKSTSVLKIVGAQGFVALQYLES